MQSYASFLVEEYADKLDEKGINYLNQIMRSAVRLDQLIQDVLSYTRVLHSKLPMEPVDLDRLVRDRVQTDERIRGISEQLKSYRDRDRAMNDALISAQQLRTETMAQVEREREVVLRETQAQADQLLLDARTEVERLLQQARNEEQRLVHGNDLARRQFQARDVYIVAWHFLRNFLAAMTADKAHEALCQHT